jgi:Uma2 family endonuclease
MNIQAPEADKPLILYPSSDGQPMAENTLQFRWIVTIQGGLDALFRYDPNVFVAGDLLWYPVERHPEIRAAPDAMVVFGRPKGYRDSYMQWVEGGIAPQVVFEVLSPGNTPPEMLRKLGFYDRHGVEEYYLYDPERVELLGWRREGGRLLEIPEMDGWVSPRLGVRFDLSGEELQIIGPTDGASPPTSSWPP